MLHRKFYRPHRIKVFGDKLYVFHRKPISEMHHDAELCRLSSLLNQQGTQKLFEYRLAHSPYPDFFYDAPEIIDIPTIIPLSPLLTGTHEEPRNDSDDH